jgi:hypothetical protein
VYVTMLYTGRVTKCVRDHAVCKEGDYVCTSPCCAQGVWLSVYVTMLYTRSVSMCVRDHTVHRASD